MRVTLSNAIGAEPVRFDAATVAVRSADAGVVEGSLRNLTFGGEKSVVIPPAAIAVSDPVGLQVADRADLAISIFVARKTTASTQLTQAHQTNYLSGPGDFSASTSFAPASTITSWYWLSGVEVRQAHGRRGAAVVAFGDSITEGYLSTLDTNKRWPDILAQRLIAAGAELSVVNMGIGGNRVLNDEIGPNAQRRLDRELLTQSGAEFAIFLEGINDIGISVSQFADFPPNVLLTDVSAAEIIGGYKQIIRRAHSAGITIFGGTLTPFGQSDLDTPESEAKRQAVNSWIRSGCGFDAVIDFDAGLRDPQEPTQLLAAYDSGDHLHPNDEGYRTMGELIDLRLFSRQRASRAAREPCQ